MIYNDELYIFFFPEIANQFFKNAEENVQAGDARWTEFWGDLEAGPFNTECKMGNECVQNAQPVPGIPSSSRA